MFNLKTISRLLPPVLFAGVLMLNTVASAQTLYTGLVIDARGLGVLPSMSPKIFDATGNEVYGTMIVDPDFVIEQGIAGFAESVDTAVEDGIVGGNPMVVRAISLADEDPSRGSVVIRDTDAVKVIAANAKSAFFNTYKVAIIM